MTRSSKRHGLLGGGASAQGNKHVKCYPPNDQRMVPVPDTPSDWRTVKNKRSQLRRSGLAI